jgi:hypothetical protein
MTSANPWKALLLAYPRMDVRVGSDRFDRKRFAHDLPDAELQDALNSFRAFPGLAEELSNGEATVTVEIVIVKKPLRSVTSTGGEQFWPSPGDTRKELNQYAATGQFDSLFVFWPNTNFQTGVKVPCAGWGLGCGPVDGTYGATYAVVSNAQSWAWKIPIVGEVWLHEWLHGVCRIFMDKGCSMPEYDADGGGSHGYVQSPTTGWTSFYRDLMTGRVLEDGICKGITAEAWRGHWVKKP